MSDLLAERPSKTQLVINLFDSLPLGSRVSVPDIMHLGIGPYSRRIEDARHRYFPLGFLIINQMESRNGENFSWYFKARCEDYPEEYQRTKAAYERWLAKHSAEPSDSQPTYSTPPAPKRKRRFASSSPEFVHAVKTWEQVCAERDAKIAASNVVPDLVLT